MPIRSLLVKGRLMQSNEARAFSKELEEIGLSIADWCVLRVLVDFALPPSRLVSETSFRFRGDKIEQPAQAYPQAVEKCMRNGWITAVTEEQHLAYERMWADESIPFLENLRVPEIGDIDITNSGYDLYRLGREKRFGPYVSGTRYVESSFRMEIYADDEETCCHRAYWYFDTRNRMENSPDGTEIVFEKMVGPFAVGAWRLNRFEVIPRGFLIIVQYVRKG
jgi:hypothetical protein